MSIQADKKRREEAWRRFSQWEAKNRTEGGPGALSIIGEIVDIYLKMHPPLPWTPDAVEGIVKMRKALSHIKKVA